MLGIGAAVAGWLGLETHAHGYSVFDPASYGLLGAAPWGVWALLLVVMRRLSGGVYHPPIREASLSPGRRRVMWLVPSSCPPLHPVPLGPPP